MKTIHNIHSPGLIIRLAILFLVMYALISNLGASVVTIADIPTPATEQDVNDIPFDTHEIVIDYFFDKAMAGVELRPDTDVNDIPFNTAFIRQLSLELYTTSFTKVPAESEVNDIPFDTHEIVQQYRITRLGNALSLMPECTVNDIPFEVKTVFAGINQQKKASVEPKFLSKLPDHVLGRFVNVIKAGLISMIILLSAGILGFLFFSYVY